VKISVVAEQGDQDGVYNINDAELTSFKYTNIKNNVDVSITSDGLAEFNAQHKNEIVNIASEYADFESPEEKLGNLSEGLDGEFDDELELADYVMSKYGFSEDEATVFAYDYANEYVFPATTVEVEEFYNKLMSNAHLDEKYEEAIKKIDSYPFGGTPRTMKKSEDYGDNQPTNPDLRVKSNELNKFIDEVDALEPQYNGLSPQSKENYIHQAKEMIENWMKKMNIDPASVEYGSFRKSVKELATSLFEMHLAVNRVNEVSDYPKELGKKFKTKKQYQPEKKKRDTTTNISEIDKYVPMNVGSVVEIEKYASDDEILRATDNVHVPTDDDEDNTVDEIEKYASDDEILRATDNVHVPTDDNEDETSQEFN
jgi:hypothetical protein